MRGYANDQQEPVSQHQMFVRASWPQAFTRDVELSAFAFVDLLDGSVLSQLSASYYLSDAWTASAYCPATWVMLARSAAVFLNEPTSSCRSPGIFEHPDPPRQDQPLGKISERCL